MPLISQQDLTRKLDRRKGFSGRATSAMFIATIVNFLLFTYIVGNEVARFIVFIRKALAPDIGYPLSERRKLVNIAIRNLDRIFLWALNFPVSINLSLSDLYLLNIHARWRYFLVISLSFGGLGPCSEINSG